MRTKKRKHPGRIGNGSGTLETLSAIILNHLIAIVNRRKGAELHGQSVR